MVEQDGPKDQGQTAIQVAGISDARDKVSGECVEHGTSGRPIGRGLASGPNLRAGGVCEDLEPKILPVVRARRRGRGRYSLRAGKRARDGDDGAKQRKIERIMAAPRHVDAIAERLRSIIL